MYDTTFRVSSDPRERWLVALEARLRAVEVLCIRTMWASRRVDLPVPVKPVMRVTWPGPAKLIGW